LEWVAGGIGVGRARRVSGDRGSGAIWLLTMSLVVVLAGAAASVRGLAALARHHAESAADLAALGGATQVVQGAADACAVARSVAASNAARLTGCRLSGAVVTVTVTCPVGGGLGRWQARAEARAGPAP
jgi:secretion/DNA translocation related TadE-like protein